MPSVLGKHPTSGDDLWHHSFEYSQDLAAFSIHGPIASMDTRMPGTVCEPKKTVPMRPGRHLSGDDTLYRVQYINTMR